MLLTKLLTFLTRFLLTLQLFNTGNTCSIWPTILNNLAPILSILKLSKLLQFLFFIGQLLILFIRDRLLEVNHISLLLGHSLLLLIRGFSFNNLVLCGGSSIICRWSGMSLNDLRLLGKSWRGSSLFLVVLLVTTLLS